LELDHTNDSLNAALRTMIATTEPKSATWTMCFKHQKEKRQVSVVSVYDYAYVITDEFDTLPSDYDATVGLEVTQYDCVVGDTSECSYIAFHFPSEIDDDHKHEVLKALAMDDSCDGIRVLGYERDFDATKMVFRGALQIEQAETT